MIAYCSKPGHGTRLIPEGTIKGIQWMRTPDYIQIAAFIDQTKLNIPADDYGGELDPHGADTRGNPLGGLLYSNAWTGGGDQYTQVIEWHNFIGANFVCFKACDPSRPNAARYCEHIFDRIGCAYNAPNNAQEGVFEVCEGENQDFPGVYTENGQVLTYQQPPESLGVISTMPYQPRVPASSNCVQHASSELYAGIATVQVPGATPTGTTGTARPTTGTGTRTGTAGAASSTSNGASTAAISMLSLAGVVFSALFLS
jgi:hypothetical protein